MSKSGSSSYSSNIKDSICAVLISGNGNSSVEIPSHKLLQKKQNFLTAALKYTVKSSCSAAEMLTEMLTEYSAKDKFYILRVSRMSKG